ncbi:hypothetical protein HED50_14425 [Ochrobactrum oryzae]|nr:hypothetical protein [Brucella oryzae]
MLAGAELSIIGAGNISASTINNLLTVDGTFDVSAMNAGTIDAKRLVGTAGGHVNLGAKDFVIAAAQAGDDFAGIIDGSGRLELKGGTQVLSGSNSYTGTTTISGGTLIVNGNQTGATGTTTVRTNAALGGGVSSAVMYSSKMRVGSSFRTTAVA